MERVMHTESQHVAGAQRPQVIGIQRRSPRAESVEPWANFDHHCAVDRVIVQTHAGRVEVFLHLVDHEGQGVGLDVPRELATTVGHLLLAAAEGRVDTITASVPPLQSTVAAA
jgi:hypothetical protein